PVTTAPSTLRPAAMPEPNPVTPDLADAAAGGIEAAQQAAGSLGYNGSKTQQLNEAKNQIPKPLQSTVEDLYQRLNPTVDKIDFYNQISAIITLAGTQPEQAKDALKLVLTG